MKNVLLTLITSFIFLNGLPSGSHFTGNRNSSNPDNAENPFLSILTVKDKARQSISLSGTWQIAEGKLDEVPSEFTRRVPVPGLVDMAEPAFEATGAETRERAAENMYDNRREAYWYRRTLTMEWPVPDVALLKIHKAKYGVKVFLNGEVVAESSRSFTPVYCVQGQIILGWG